MLGFCFCMNGNGNGNGNRREDDDNGGFLDHFRLLLMVKKSKVMSESA